MLGEERQDTMSLTPLKEVMLLDIIRAHPSHGYAIADVLSRGLGESLGMTKSTIYATLQRFSRRGWVHSERESESNFPDREIYSLTQEGEKALATLLEKCAFAVPPPLFPLAALLLHIDALPTQTRREALAHIREARHARRNMLQAFPPHTGSAGVALALMLDQLQLELDALDQLIQDSADD